MCMPIMFVCLFSTSRLYIQFILRVLHIMFDKPTITNPARTILIIGINKMNLMIIKRSNRNGVEKKNLFLSVKAHLR